MGKRDRTRKEIKHRVGKRGETKKRTQRKELKTYQSKLI